MKFCVNYPFKEAVEMFVSNTLCSGLGMFSEALFFIFVIDIWDARLCSTYKESTFYWSQCQLKKMKIKEVTICPGWTLTDLFSSSLSYAATKIPKTLVCPGF